MRHCVWGLVIVGCVVACSTEGANAPRPPADHDAGLAGGAGGTAGGDGGGGGSRVSTSTSIEGDVIHAAMTVRNVARTEEGHLCVDIQLPNTTEVWMTALHARIGDGSHHMIVSRSGHAAPSPDAWDCGPLLGSDESRLVIAQQHDTVFTLPSAAGFALPARAVVTMQLHYVNVASGPIDVSGSIEITTQPRTTPLAEARIVFTGGFGLSLPANARSASDFFLLLGEPGRPLHVFALTSHTHQLGVRATIRRQANQLDEGTLLHESLSWSDPPLDRFDPVLVFDGSDGLHLRCEYNNTTNRPVGFGIGFNDEMCFMWLYAY